ncbi:P-loop containing nucleoside triphosphate hydrolase protein [Auriculariales sp. MPI-PUGE-AT-0066]|nr:P-loop containing nucleoside triphosphate hydrolase protein [Auriculariales sp. MPI-PUGE-AT-0066]
MSTTFRDFNNLIAGVQAREKQRLAAEAAITNAEKDKKNTTTATTAAATTAAAAAGKSTAELKVSGENSEPFRIEDMAELQTHLISEASGALDKARDIVSGLLTSRASTGEYVVRLGRHPHHDLLFGLVKEDAKDAPGPLGNKCTADEIRRAHARLCQVADEIGCKVSTLFTAAGDSADAHASYLIRLPPPTVELAQEVRVAVVGNVDAGKSTTLGVLTRGALDDGRGRARIGLFRHLHEQQSGRTSSVGMEILGFNAQSVPILPPASTSSDPDVIRREKLSWAEISIEAAKIIAFLDLAGHEKYLKTTLFGISSGAPSVVLLMVGANAGLIGMSKEHLAIALALNVPVAVCITKIDMTPPNIIAETVKQVTKVLRSPGCRKTPVFVKTTELAVELSQAFDKDRLCPIFMVSNVTGEGLDHIRTFLNLLPSSEGDESKFDRTGPLDYSVTEVWSVPYTGTVVNGIIHSGSIKVGDNILLGPDSTGGWIQTAVKSMQRKRSPVTSADAGQSVSLALKRVRKAQVRKGMVIVQKTETPPRAVRRFEGQVLILYHNTTLQKNYQAMLHCGAIRQSVRIVSMDSPAGILRTGDRATVEFEFIQVPELVKVGSKLLFREGRTKGLGVVTRLIS